MEEDVIYVAKLHWILFLGPVLLLLAAIFTGTTIAYYPLKPVLAVVMVGAWIWGIVIWVKYHFSSLTIKKKQLILRTGFFVRQTVDIPFARIESIDIRQSILGTLLHYGSLIITGTGGSRQIIHDVAKPLICRRYVEQFMHH